MLKDVEIEALAEVFNIGIGQAASALAEICEKEVRMSVPQVRLIPADQVQQIDLGDEERRHCVGVRMDFKGFIDASGVLVFAERGALDLVRLVTREAGGHGAMSDLEVEAIAEIGNIMFNYWLGSIGNLMGEEVTSELPIVEQGPYRDLLLQIDHRVEHLPILLVHVDLKVNDTSIKGRFIIALRSPSLQEFARRIVEQYFRSNVDAACGNDG